MSRLFVTVVVSVLAVAAVAAPPVAGQWLTLRLTIRTTLQYANTPMDPLIDFAAMMDAAEVDGVVDADSIEVFNVATGRIIPHGLTGDFAEGDRGRVEFVVADPQHTDFEIRFRAADQRPAQRPSPWTPPIGVGDLLRFNASVPRPIAVPYSIGLHDLNGDGKLDLTGTWNYARRPGEPWDAIICFARTSDSHFRFGDLQRVRCVSAGDGEPAVISHTYMGVAFADFNHDGDPDLVLTRKGTKSADFYLNSGQRDPGGMPQFVAAGSVEVAGWQAVRAVDLNNDNALDLVVNGVYVQNSNPQGWPFDPAPAIKLEAGRKPCFLDVDGDGWNDAVCLQGDDSVQPDFYRVAWRRNLGKAAPEFAAEQIIDEIAVPEISLVAAWHDAGRSGLIVQHGAFQEVSFYELEAVPLAEVPSVRRDNMSLKTAAVPPPRQTDRMPAGQVTDRDEIGDRPSYGLRPPPQPGRRKQKSLLVFTSAPAERIRLSDDRPSRRFSFRKAGRAESVSAVMSLSDQAWPCLCDWDDDGDQDLLVGGGYGWPRIVINDGSLQRPAFREPARIFADGRPIRLLRNEILGEPRNWHDMGYSFPVFVDWDADGLNDLILPNETNRIFWYRNTGTRTEPLFAQRQQIICDGFPDPEQQRRRSNARANDPQSNNGVYPLEPERPFFWRTGAAIADFNADGLPDLVTHDGHTRVATLFVQDRDDTGRLRLRKDRPLLLADGRPVTDAIVNRRAHWTESFRSVDWDQDGLQDLIYSVAGAHHGTLDGGSIYLLRNVGSPDSPLFAAPQTMKCFGEPIRITNHGPHPWPGDFDGDGRPDLIACVEWSVYPFYSHAALMMGHRPEYTIEVLDE